ncbi:MAG: CotH kinase family protein, partial [Chitinophagales bacterium]|nr:CotH kinase family protein [Chitinophagales bacterium]
MHTPFNAFPTFQHEATVYRGGVPERFQISHNILRSIIKQGENVLAIQTHNSFQSNDLSSNYFLSFGIADARNLFRPVPAWFDSSPSFFHTNFRLAMGKTIYLFNPFGRCIDSLYILECDIDHSFGRVKDGSDTLCYFYRATPNMSNDSNFSFSEYYEITGIFPPAGFYDSSIFITLQAPPGVSVHYTIGGKTPDESDPVFSAPIRIDTTCVVSFRAYGNGAGKPGKTIRHTYFIAEPQFSLPLISISTDPINLWSDSIGIYTKGQNYNSLYPYFGANFWKKWERLSHIEYFGEDKQLKFKGPFGLKIHGNWSRGQPQKGLRVDFDHKYGFPMANYPLIPDKQHIHAYRAFNLRNAGNDYFGSRFRDALMQRSMKNTHVDYMGYSPAVVYLNGCYWGLYEIREKVDQEYLRFNHHVNPNAVDLISYDHNLGFQVHNGTDSAFYDMFYRITATPPDADSFETLVKKFIDFKNYSDYFIAQIFYANSDWMGEWTNNIKCWKAHEPGSRWRYILWDMDFGCGFKNPDGNKLMSKPDDYMWNRARRPLISNEHSRLFNHIISNKSLRNYFLNRMADLVNTTLRVDSFEALATQMKNEILSEISRHHQKWGGNMASFEQSIENMIEFVRNRPQYLFQHAVEEFQLNKHITITLDIQPEGAGHIFLNTIDIKHFPFSGTYFDGVPVNVKAIANDEYEFSHWHALRNFNSLPYDSLHINITESDTLVAVFRNKTTSSVHFPKEQTNTPHLFNKSNTWVIISPHKQIITCTLYDILGKKIDEQTDNEKCIFTKNGLAKGVYIIQAAL